MVCSYNLCCANPNCRLNRAVVKMSDKIQTKYGQRSEVLLRVEYAAQRLGHSDNFIDALKTSGIRTTAKSTFYRYQSDIDDNNVEVVDNCQRILVQIAADDGGSQQLCIDCTWSKSGHSSAFGHVNLLDLDALKWFDKRPKVSHQICN